MNTRSFSPTIYYKIQHKIYFRLVSMIRRKEEKVSRFGTKTRMEYFYFSQLNQISGTNEIK